MTINKKFKNIILDYFKEHENKEVSFKTLCYVFNVKGQGRKKLKDILFNLEDDGYLRYKPKNLYIYSSVKKEKEITKKAKNSVDDSKNKNIDFYEDLIAIYHQGTDTYQPLQHGITKIMLSALEDDAESNGLVDGNIVLIKPMKHKDSNKVKAAKFIKVIAPSVKGNESMLSILSADLPYAFPEEVLDEVEKIESGLTKEEISKREDLRQLPFVTIDGEDAKDFDDAVYAEKWVDKNGKDKGGFHIIVAIADVAFYIKENSRLEKEALKRGNSTYFPDMVVPMLPEKLCNDLCSLKPNEDRPVMAVHLYIDGSGSLKKYKFSRAVIHSHKRLTYNQVQTAIEGEFNEIIDKSFYEEVIVPLEQAFEVLQEKRVRRGALEIETVETQILFDDDSGDIVDIIPRSRFIAHMLIEELMILANIASARALEQYACMYRVHEEPSKEKVNNLQKNLDGLKVKFKMNTKSTNPFEFKKLIDNVGARQDRETIMTLILRSQSQAKYSSDNLGHFGLALTHYAHFTSPIRRFSDLIVHRLLIASLSLPSKGGVKYSKKKIDEIAEHISTTERTSQKAEWDAKERFIARYYSNKMNSSFNARVVSINSFGMFIRIPETGAEGLVPFRTMKNDYYFFDEKTNTLRGKRTRKVVTVGTKIRVKLTQANIIFGKLSFDFESFK